MLQCSARAAASEYCPLELHATQRCSSPVQTVYRVTPSVADPGDTSVSDATANRAVQPATSCVDI